MTTIKNGFRLNKNGKPIDSIEQDALDKSSYQGPCLMVDGVYYYFNRNQAGHYIYLPD